MIAALDDDRCGLLGYSWIKHGGLWITGIHWYGLGYIWMDILHWYDYCTWIMIDV